MAEEEETMQTFTITIEETLSRTFSVSAPTAEDAQEKAIADWKAGKTVLDASDFTAAAVSVDGSGFYDFV